MKIKNLLLPLCAFVFFRNKLCTTAYKTGGYNP